MEIHGVLFQVRKANHRAANSQNVSSEKRIALQENQERKYFVVKVKTDTRSEKWQCFSLPFVTPLSTMFSSRTAASRSSRYPDWDTKFS